MKRSDFHHQTSGERLISATTRQGLPIRIVPRPGSAWTSALLAVNYGSIDDRFAPEGKKRAVKVPAGIAHFLEHKMFEKEEGDLSERFSAKGAQANAMTGHRMTGYVFGCTSDLLEHLETLFEITCRPWFSEASVRKERGIIDQEIRGYDDSPWWRSWRAMLEAMYWKHPARVDIAGTSESIREITPELLMLCHRGFYVPENMVLTMTGDFDVEAVLARAEELTARHYGEGGQAALSRAEIDEPGTIRKAKTKLEMAVSMPRLVLGFKGPMERLKPKKLLEYDAAASLFIDCILSDAGPLYESLFAEGLIGDDFAHSMTVEPGIIYGHAGGQTKDPGALAERLIAALEAGWSKPLDPLALEGARRNALGDFIRMFDSPDSLTWRLAEDHFEGSDLFDWPEVMAKIDERTVRRLAREVFQRERTVQIEIHPAA